MSPKTAKKWRKWERIRLLDDWRKYLPFLGFSKREIKEIRSSLPSDDFLALRRSIGLENDAYVDFVRKIRKIKKDNE